MQQNKQKNLKGNKQKDSKGIQQFYHFFLDSYDNKYYIGEKF